MPDERTALCPAATGPATLRIRDPAHSRLAQDPRARLAPGPAGADARDRADPHADAVRRRRECTGHGLRHVGPVYRSGSAHRSVRWLAGAASRLGGRARRHRAARRPEFFIRARSRA
ncbi:hypothetical protein G6F32_015258 [Rhizopus arrhizus]|nr:hypothetical protein G6F32_015258 [Rhizopus arrhizus]